MKEIATMVYDGECRFCLASQKLLQGFVGWRLKTLPLQNPLSAQLHPELSAERAQSQLHLARGDQLFGGMEAVVQTLALRPIGKIALIYYAPLARPLLDAMYGWIARHRYRLFGRVVIGGCENDACAIEPQELEAQAT